MVDGASGDEDPSEIPSDGSQNSRLILRLKRRPLMQFYPEVAREQNRVHSVAMNVRRALFQHTADTTGLPKVLPHSGC